MCGITGVAGSVPVLDRSWLAAGAAAMRHRGPDDSGEWWSQDGCVGLGHRRLAIVDLSAAGHQPMHDSTGELTIVFNGEIYNFQDLRAELLARGHAFHSLTDTEVILAAYREWGTDCLRRFNGMFALAIHDASRKTVFLARDRAGEKPLFYTCEQRVLRFSSELKGLLADPGMARGIDPEALDLYLALGYVPGERCIVRGARKLPAAHALSFDLQTGATSTWRYWQLPQPAHELSSESAAEQLLLSDFEALLEDAVRRQLYADVPVGVLLSGGVDSSLITAMAVRASRQVRTFTVGFAGHGNYDESAHARLIAEHFGTQHLQLDAGRISPELLPALAHQYDEPLVDSSMIPTFLVSRLVRQHCTVALGGDGGDELFGGYPHYDRLLRTKAGLHRLPRPLRRLAATAARSCLPTGYRGRNWLQSLDCDLDEDLPLLGQLFDGTERQQLMGGACRSWNSSAERIWRAAIPAADDMLERITRLEFQTYLAEDILVKVDRASMLNSLEVRAPLLDVRMIEFAFGRVPARLKATAQQRKILPKRLAAKLFPPGFDRHRKQGFSIPLGTWLAGGEWRDYFHAVLLGPDCLFDRKAVQRLLKGQERGRHNQERLFALVLFELWRREYHMTL